MILDLKQVAADIGMAPAAPTQPDPEIVSAAEQAMQDADPAVRWRGALALGAAQGNPASVRAVAGPVGSNDDGTPAAPTATVTQIVELLPDALRQRAVTDAQRKALAAARFDVAQLARLDTPRADLDAALEKADEYAHAVVRHNAQAAQVGRAALDHGLPVPVAESLMDTAMARDAPVPPGPGTTNTGTGAPA